MSQFFLSGKTQRINFGSLVSLDVIRSNIFSTLATGLAFLNCMVTYNALDQNGFSSPLMKKRPEVLLSGGSNANLTIDSAPLSGVRIPVLEFISVFT